MPVMDAVRADGPAAVSDRARSRTARCCSTRRAWLLRRTSTCCAHERAAALGELKTWTWIGAATVALLVLAAIALGVALWVTLRRWILEPLDDLAAHARAVSSGRPAAPGRRLRPGRDHRPRRRRRAHAGDARRPGAGPRGVAAPDRRGQRPADRAGRRARPLEPRPRAVRLRRVARPAGAAAQGGQLHPAAAEAVRRPARRTRRPVHRVRRGRRQAHAAAHPGPARVLARGTRGRRGDRRRPGRCARDRRWTS